MVDEGDDWKNVEVPAEEETPASEDTPTSQEAPSPSQTAPPTGAPARKSVGDIHAAGYETTTIQPCCFLIVSLHCRAHIM